MIWDICVGFQQTLYLQKNVSSHFCMQNSYIHYLKTSTEVINNRTQKKIKKIKINLPIVTTACQFVQSIFLKHKNKHIL